MVKRIKIQADGSLDFTYQGDHFLKSQKSDKERVKGFEQDPDQLDQETTQFSHKSDAPGASLNQAFDQQSAGLLDPDSVSQLFGDLSLSDTLRGLKAAALAPDADDMTIALYLELALQEGDYDDLLESLTLIQPDIEERSISLQWDRAYMQALLATWQLDKFKTMLDQRRQSYGDQAYALASLDQLEADYRRQEEAWRAEEAAEQAKLLADVAQAQDLPFHAQQALIPRLNILDREAYRQAALSLLGQADFHPILKAYLLEGLKEKGFDDQVAILWYNQWKSVDLATLHDVLDSPILQGVRGEDWLVQNLTLYVSLAYPFEQEIFPQSSDWLEALEARHQGDMSNAWLARLDEQAQKMVF